MPVFVLKSLKKLSNRVTQTNSENDKFFHKCECEFISNSLLELQNHIEGIVKSYLS